jgi:hypothetical protein
MARLWPALLIAAVLGTAGCGASAEPPRHAPSASAESPRPHASVDRARCTPGAANCAAVTGRVLYVEADDPDGDGDAHYILAGGHVTAPGLSVIDVERALRPRRLPHPGELVSAAGPVFRGSFGQRQIEATELHHQRHSQ